MRTRNLKYETTKSVMDALSTDEFRARLVLRIARYGFGHFLDGEVDIMFPITTRWIGHCHIYPSEYEITMQMMCEVLDGYGVEPICLNNENANLDPHKINGGLRFEHINMGDTYTATAVWDWVEFKWFISTIGDVVEAMEHKCDYHV